MKPTNNDTPTCNPISSNCVIWQGPDIDCIKLCKGDTVSDVVFKLATELCIIMTELNISSYDLTCLNLVGCDPKDFQALLQLLIDKICALDACCNQTPGTGKSGCPDCVVDVAPCFHYTDQYGNLITTMQLSDYVTTIGHKVCDILSSLDIINQTLVNYNIRITTLENAPPPTFSIPTIVPVCVLPSVPTEVQIVVSALEQQFCELEGSTGLPVEIYSAIAQQCPGLASAPALGPSGGTMGSILGWANPVNNLADSITNMWLTICDLRSAILSIQTNCCPTGCDGITLSLSAVVDSGTSTLRVYINGTIPIGFLQCSGLGTLFTFADTLGGTFTQYIDVITNLNNPGGVPIDLSATPVNPASNINISATVCLTNSTTDSTCSSALTYFVNNEAICPILTITPDVTSIAYSFVASTTGTYTIQLYNNAGTVLLAQNISAIVAPVLVTGIFPGLTASTPYKVRMTIGIGGSVTTCPFTPGTTLPGPCLPPTSVSAIITVI